MTRHRIADERMAKLGNAMRLLFLTERKSFNLAACHLWLWPPIRLDQIVYTTDRDGLWTGFATWAYLSRETGRRMVAEDPPFLDIAEWNEGSDLWIVDVVAPGGDARVLAGMLRDRLGGRYASAQRIVRDRRGAIRCARRIPFHPTTLCRKSPE